MSTDPTFVSVHARDLVPYKHAIWSSVGGSPPFENMVAVVQFTKDGRVSVMLDSHNFLHLDPDEEVPSCVERVNLSSFEQRRIANWRGPRRHDAGPFDD